MRSSNSISKMIPLNLFHNLLMLPEAMNSKVTSLTTSTLWIIYKQFKSEAFTLAMIMRGDARINRKHFVWQYHLKVILLNHPFKKYCSLRCKHVVVKQTKCAPISWNLLLIKSRFNNKKKIFSVNVPSLIKLYLIEN